MKLPKSFYHRNTLDVAKELLGKYLVHNIEGVERVGKIVEVEAYLGPHDKAAHSYNGRRTPRNEVMYGPPGYAYVYFIYGMYHCVNVVTNDREKPEAVLIRALEPVAGIKEMALARFGKELPLTDREYRNLCSGPGKLCQALSITREDNGLDLSGKKLYITYPPDERESREKRFEIVAAPRVGIAYAEEAVHYPWRFYIKGNPFVSKK
ncbi:DNA-3-methyladenine glycosylase [Aneurinibacillus terranovensis]|uniref:DNA-3-methyladenine glycosylase n=1 Tax=Aneurinibacillus terranovensis TaxID=278991 RepID=UPI00040DB078|nr:DNA-3-methyladenine glycosylase [Aneurinibacillus terranovensis]